MVDRRIVFYRWHSANAQAPFVPHATAGHLANAIEADALSAILARRDSTTAIGILAEGGASEPTRIQVIAARNVENQPVEWSVGQALRSLTLAEGYSAADVTHFTIWPDGYAAQDWHGHAPRPSRLLEFLRLRAGAHLAMNTLYRPDMLAALDRLRGRLRSVSIAVTAPELVDDERVGMLRSLVPEVFGRRVPSIKTRLSMGRYGPRDRYIDGETEETAFQIAEQAQDLLDSMTIRGRNPDTGRIQKINLLQERIGRIFTLDSNPEATSLPGETAVYGAMTAMRRELEDEGILQAAVETEAMRSS